MRSPLRKSSLCGVFDPRILLAFVLCSAGVFLAMLSFAATPPSGLTRSDGNSPGNSLFSDKHAGSLSGNANAAAASEWSIVPSPNTSAAQHNYLYSVTCASPSDPEAGATCWAVGFYQTDEGNPQTLILRWDGTSWAIAPSPNPLLDENTQLHGVTCTSASNCWAVGYSFNLATVQTLILRWDGSSWAIFPSPNVTAAQSNFLKAVTCVSASDCWAVGQAIDLPDRIRFETLTEHWDGTSWAIVPSPNPNPDIHPSNSLTGVTCVSASECWAVGHSSDPVAAHTMILRWDGSAWAIVPSPNTNPSLSNFLSGVTCTSASNPEAGAVCWAVGGHEYSGSVGQTLIQRWDGSSWAIVSSPNTSFFQDNYFSGITCASPSDCWAVGQYDNGTAWQTLTARYTPQPTLTPTSVVSRKTHGTAGTFDVHLPLTGNAGIECRSGGSDGNYQIVVTFPIAVACNSAQVIIGIGRVSSFSVSGDGTEVTLNLTNIANAQEIVATLNVGDATGTGDVSVSMGVLVGDTSANSLVNSTDISQTQAQSGQGVTGSNFRTDVNVNGLINSTDISIVQSKSGTGLP